MYINGKDVSRTGIDCNGIGGHSELDVKRYHNDTRHMIIYDAYCESHMGEQGARMRQFLTEEEYAAAKDAEKLGNIRIVKHAAIVEGHILWDRKRRK